MNVFPQSGQSQDLQEPSIMGLGGMMNGNYQHNPPYYQNSGYLLASDQMGNSYGYPTSNQPQDFIPPSLMGQSGALSGNFQSNQLHSQNSNFLSGPDTQQFFDQM